MFFDAGRLALLSKLRSRLTYANVMATVALFVALGGSSYAAIKVSGKNVKDRSLTGKDIKKSSLTTAEVRNHSLLGKDFRPGQLPSGPQGPQGAQGQNGATNVVQRLAIGTASATESFASAHCLPGERATGGGVTRSSQPPAVPVVASSGPFKAGASGNQDGLTPDSWSGTLRNDNTDPTTPGSVTALVWVVCASP